ncbi:unnamed protein product [Camellia sinensis]
MEELVFEDDTLTWDDVARAAGVEESSQRTRSTRAIERGCSTSKSAARPRLQLIDEEESISDGGEEEDAEGYAEANDNEEEVHLLDIIDVLEFIPSHVAVVFDHDGTRRIVEHETMFQDCLSISIEWHGLNNTGIPFGHSSVSSKQSFVAKEGLNFLIEVPGVEADDVIGTLAIRSVDAGFKVRVVSPDKDFFQILSPSLRLLRIAPRGFEMVSFGLEDFAEKFGALKPSQFVDVMSLVGDRSDNIPARKHDLNVKTRLTICEGRDGTEFSDGDVLIIPEMIKYRGLKDSDVDNFVEDVGRGETSAVSLFKAVGRVQGIGNVHAVQLIMKYGSLENLLQQIDRVEEERIRQALISNADQAILSKNLALLRSDLPFYMVPFSTNDLRFKKPELEPCHGTQIGLIIAMEEDRLLNRKCIQEDNGDKFTSLLTAISAYAEGFSADSIIRRVFYLWKKLEKDEMR